MNPTAEHPHLAQLYAISNLLLRTGDVGGSFGEIVELIGKEFPIRGACLAVEDGEGASAVVVEDPADPVEHRMAAREHACEAYEYLTARGAVPPDAMTVVSERRAARRAPEQAVLMVLPLVVAHHPIAGVLQLEMAERADETALLFLSTLAHQLALVLDRHSTVASRVAEADDRAARHSARWDAANLQREVAENLRERFTALVDDLDQAFVWECDATSFALRYVSARSSHYLGGDRQAWVRSGTSLVDLTLPADRDALSSALRRARDGNPQRIDHRCFAADGSELWFHTNVHLAERAAGKPRLQGVSFDVTAAKEAESALRDQLDFTCAITGSLGEGVIVADRGGRVTSANAAACALLDISPALILGNRFRSMVGMHAPDGTLIPDAECPLTRAGREGIAFAEDDIGFVCGERAFAASFTCTPLRTRDKLSGAVMVFRNMSPLKRAERSQRLLADLSAALGGTLERATAIRRLVEYAARTICDVAIFESIGEEGATGAVEGARRDGLPIDAADLLSGVAPEERAKVLASREPVVLRVGRSASVPHPSGFFSSAGIDSLVMLPLCARDRPIGVLSLYGWEDHYQEHPDRELLAELARRAAIAIDNAQLHENAQHARRVRDDMLAVVSHDLKNPLGAILLYTDSMLRSHDPTIIEGGLQRIRRSADKMTHLIRDLLDVASIEAGRFAIERRPVSIAEVIVDALESPRALAAKKGVELESVVAEGLPLVSIDPHRFDQMIANLVGNAIKFAAPGGAVQIKAEPSPIGVRFSVLDTGPGIAALDQAHVFDRFWQARKTARLGTGLGLFIARAIVEAHGGSLHVESREGVGTMFWFEIATNPRHPAATTSGGVAEIEALSERTLAKTRA